MSLAETYSQISSSLVKLSSGQLPKLIAISKYASDEALLEAYQLGIRDFGENYVLAALRRKEKFSTIAPGISWHLTGHLQKNKVNKAVGNFELIQSLDSYDLAVLIAKRASSIGIIQKVLLQINISEEKTKYGFTKELIEAQFADLIKLNGLKPEGLMTMAPEQASAEELTGIFAALRSLRDQLSREHNYPLEQLSMGMSNDYALAIPQGSTMIRLGRALFKDGTGQKPGSVV